MRDLPSFVKKCSIVAFVGDESFFKEEAAHAWLKQLQKQFNCDESRFDNKSKMGDIEVSLDEYPLIGNCKVVYFKDVDKIKKWERITPWVKDPLPDVKAVFVFSDDIKDLPEGWLDHVDLKVVCNDMGPDSQEFQKYIDYCMEPSGKSLAEDAREFVVQTFAHNLAFLKHELLKCSYYSSGNVLTRQEIIKSLSSYPVVQVFDLVDSVIARDLKKSLQLADELVGQGTESSFLVHLISQRLRTIEGVLLAQQSGEKLKDYMIRKKIPLFQYGALIQGIKTLSLWRINHLFDVLCETDYRLRSFADGRLEIERAILSLCG